MGGPKVTKQDQKALIEIIGATVTKLHKILLPEGSILIKSHCFAMRCTLILANSSIKAPRNSDFALFSKFCFLNNFLLKS